MNLTITSWNLNYLLRACLYSINLFSPVDSFVTIVVDNASKDFPSDMAEREFLQVTLVKRAVNTRHAAMTISASRIHPDSKY